MKVSDAVLARRSIRAFTPQPINNKVIKDLLALAARSPSGGNLQPWKIYVVNNQSMKKFIEFQDNWDQPETPGYPIYPSGLTEPYRTSRYQLGEAMYELLGIPREDKDARLQQVLRNFEFFGAPAAIFCFVDKQMGPPQWSDLGMFLQTFMLAATDVGLATCAQEAWAMKPETVAQFVGAPDELMLFCGVAIGQADTTAPVNALVSKRFSVDEFTTFVS